MRVVEVIIDGFKSYAVRTVISGWDESFNSITGLNGSGKSNILDAICFVLGITNMSTVRAQNLQDLIYKRGQAGVTKASVTIVFDNRDTKKSPIGFEGYTTISVTRQIVLGGTSKYLINGHRAQQQTVQNLFQSVQLNINNPNFLIMQGKITKVLNMKPVEILAMIEEAAGTRMFEDRRDKALKTMAKKEMKLKEINELLRDEIEPKLEKLRTEKRAFLDFQQTQNDLERMTKLVVAFNYYQYNRKLSQSAAELDGMRQRRTELEENATRLKSEISHLEHDLKQLMAERDKELRKRGKAQSFESEVKKFSNELVRLGTIIDLKKNNLAEEQEKKKLIEASVAELEASLQQKTTTLERITAKYDKANEQLAQQKQEAEAKEELLQTLQTGVASKEGHETGFQGQLQDARSRIMAATTEQEQAKVKIAHLEKRIKEDEPKAKKAKEQNAGLLRDLEELRTQAASLQSELEAIGIEPGKEEAMQKREAELQQTLRGLRQQTDELKRKVANIDFNYSDPVPDFVRSRVKGLVASLFTLDPQHSKAATALEICAGSRLYNVVVDTEVTGTQLLQGGKLKKRVTIIPLNKIASFRASAQAIATAQKLAPGKVDLALTLVGYDAEVAAAMEYVFGSTLVCADAVTAQKVTFDPSVRMRSITFDGDSYDPAGTVSGGSAATGSGVLMRLQALHDVERRVTQTQRELAEVRHSLAVEKPRFDAARRLRQQLDLRQHEIGLADAQIAGNASSSVLRDIADMREQVTLLRAAIAEAEARRVTATKDAARIEKDMADFDNNKDGKLVELQKGLDVLRAAVATNAAAVKKLHKEVQTAQLDAENAGADLTTAREAVQEVELAARTQDEELAQLGQQVAGFEKQLAAAQERLDAERAKLHGFDDELRAVEEALRTKTARVTEEGLELQRLRHTMERFHKEQQAAAEAVARLDEQHAWIASERDKFGRAGTAYAFNGHDFGESSARLAKLKERFDGLKRKINPKVMNMIDSVEKKEVGLKNMMRTVIRDKRKIEETIASLDDYKKKALQETWQKVNGDFGQIFSELLPGSFARLDPPEGRAISDGLEVKVCLGQVWKQSLAELSGGQRSLIALSLIMALLQFKPAPMYILDEVDAALDLSHTQNIGRLIKTRFKGSQFIVVSLKDGMFQNANRIFRTRFSDGTSMVQALTPADLK